nr:hypothetical protein Iba_chr02bCG13600 [Ipomoea batatas]GMC63156.1 hypothetical protein Iba_chr02cCG10640 [Ipomoea batatas]
MRKATSTNDHQTDLKPLIATLTPLPKPLDSDFVLLCFKSHLKQSSLSEEDDMGPWSSHKLIQVSGILIGMHLKLLMRLVYTLHKLDQICTIFTRGIGGKFLLLFSR